MYVPVQFILFHKSICKVFYIESIDILFKSEVIFLFHFEIQTFLSKLTSCVSLLYTKVIRDAILSKTNKPLYVVTASRIP